MKFKIEILTTLLITIQAKDRSHTIEPWSNSIDEEIEATKRMLAELEVSIQEKAAEH